MVNLTRRQLHAWLWSEPTTRVAERLGVSETTLRRTCLKYEVPTPPRGYWTQLRQGQHPEVQALPKPEKELDLPIGIDEETADRIGRRADADAAADLSLEATAGTEQRESNAAPAETVRAAASKRPSLADGEQDSCGVAARHRGIPTHASSYSGALASGELQPSAAAIVALAQIEWDVAQARSFVHRVDETALACSPAARAVAALWVHRARLSLAALDPITQVIESCQRVAAGAETPAWLRAAGCRNRAEADR
jgi:hypothetical protein